MSLGAAPVGPTTPGARSSNSSSVTASVPSSVGTAACATPIHAATIVPTPTSAG